MAKLRVFRDYKNFAICTQNTPKMQFPHYHARKTSNRGYRLQIVPRHSCPSAGDETAARRSINSYNLNKPHNLSRSLL